MKRILYSRALYWALLNSLVFLVLMSLLRLAFEIRFQPAFFSFKKHFPAFVLGLRFDLRVICILALVTWALASLPWFNPYQSAKAKRGWLWFMASITLLFCIFYTSDFAHYAYLSERLNATVLNYTQDAALSATMGWQSYPVIKISLAVVAIILFLQWIVKKNLALADGIVPASKSRKIVTSFFVFILLGLGIFGKIGQYPLRWSDAFTLGDNFSSNIALNPFQSFFSTLKFRKVTKADKKQTENYFPLMAHYLGIEGNSVLSYERKVVAVDSIRKKQINVVLVICESFSAYKSSMWGNPLNATPYFQQLCNKGVFFNYCFTPAYGTARGVWAIITGIPDVTTTKTASRNMAMVNQNTIINNFEEYKKLYFLGGSTSWANIRGLLVNNIQQLHLYEEGNFKAPKEDVWGISDKNLFLESNEVLKKQTHPFFAVIQTAGNHRPYTIPEEDLNDFKKIEFSTDSLLNNGFDNNDELNAFRYSDYCIQKFMETAKKETYFKNTLFVFIGDHGILGRPGTPFNNTWVKGDLTREHVPLLFYAPAILQPQTITAVCSQVDVLPSIASLTGRSYINTTLGRDLFYSKHLADISLFGQSAFRFNAETNQASLVMNTYYYELQMTDSKERLLYLKSNNPVPANKQSEQIKTQAREFTKAIFETSRYMLLNNKKK